MAKLVGILRSHEDDVTKDVKLVSSMGSLVLVAKGKKIVEEDSESDFTDSELMKEEYALLVSNPKKSMLFEDEELSRPIHGGCFVVKSEMQTYKV